MRTKLKFKTMNSSNNFFLLIPFFIVVAFAATIAFADGSHSKEEIVKPNEVKHGEKGNGDQAVHDVDKKGQTVPQNADANESPRRAGRTSSPNKQRQPQPWPMPLSPKGAGGKPPLSQKGNGIQANDVEKELQSAPQNGHENKAQQFGRSLPPLALPADKQQNSFNNALSPRSKSPGRGGLPPRPKSPAAGGGGASHPLKLEKLPDINTNKNTPLGNGNHVQPLQLKPLLPISEGAFDPTPKKLRTTDSLGHEVDKIDALTKVHGERLDLHEGHIIDLRKISQQIPINAQNIVTLGQNHETINNGLENVQKKVKEVDDAHIETRNSHNGLLAHYNQFLANDTEAKTKIDNRFTENETQIGNVKSELKKESGRIDAANTKQEELESSHDTLKNHLAKNVYPKVEAHDALLAEHKKKFPLLEAKDKELGEEITKVRDEHTDFIEKTYKPDLKETKEGFKLANSEIGGLKVKTKQLGDEQKVHGQQIGGLTSTVNTHKVFRATQKNKNKVQKSNIEIIQNVIGHGRNIIENLQDKQKKIDNEILDLNSKLPTLLAQNNNTINGAIQALVEANKKALEDEEENQKRMQEIARKEQEIQKEKLKLEEQKVADQKNLLAANIELSNAYEQNEEAIVKYRHLLENTRKEKIEPLQVDQAKLIEEHKNLAENQEKIREEMYNKGKIERQQIKSASKMEVPVPVAGLNDKDGMTDDGVKDD